MTKADAGRKRARGSISALPSGSLRVRVYAGRDVVSKRSHYLCETIPAGPNAATIAEKARVRLLNQVDEGRQSHTNASLNELLDRHFELFTKEPSTLDTYKSYVNKHVRAFLGTESAGKLNGEQLDSLYAELQRCGDHCDSQTKVPHYATGKHDCDDRCKKHECTPLASSTIRQIHFILSAAYERAKRWGWFAVNPTTSADPPGMQPVRPRPPTVAQTAEILNDAWHSGPDWGDYLLLSTLWGARRGEMCALRWHHIEFEHAVTGPHDCVESGCVGVIHFHRALGQRSSDVWDKDTKTHQERRIVMGPLDMAALTDRMHRADKLAEQLGVTVAEDGFVFSADPNGGRPLKPDVATRRFRRQVKRLGIVTTLKNLRHYNATELIKAGVDIRTVAGRLGHSGNGATTLRVYTAWLSEADQRAAANLSPRVPDRAVPIDEAERVRRSPRYLYERIAVSIWNQIESGELSAGVAAPSQKELMAQHEISTGTAHRVMQLLAEWGAVKLYSAKRAIILKVEKQTPDLVKEAGDQVLEIELLHLGKAVRKLQVEADPADSQRLNCLLTDAVRRHGGPSARVGDYELDVRYAGERGLITTIAA